jgi:cytochrome P450
MSHILEAGDFFKNNKMKERLLLMGDSRLLIVAGSDTTATTLVYCFYHFAKNPALVKKLREELKDKGIENNDSFSVPALQYLSYLNGLINETLRLHPPVPGGIFRNTPREGVVIDGKHLPGGVKTIGPHYTIQRCKFPRSSLHSTPPLAY